MTTRSRVALLETHPIQYHASWFAALANEPGVDLQVLYCHRSSPKEQAEAGFGVEFDWDVPLLEGYSHRFLKNVSRHPSTGSFLGLDTPEIERLIAEENFDAVVVNGWHYKSAWQTIRACWRHKVPVLVRSDSHLQTQRSPLKKMLKAPPYRWFIPRLDACLAVGEWSSKYFLHYGARPDRVFLVPHAVGPSFERDSRALLPQRAELRQRWGFEASDIVYLFAGKFISKKRPEDFIRAIHQASQACPQIRGLMLGDGPLRDQSERLAAGLGAPVRFAGFVNQSEIVKAYLAADALVLPSDGEETWGLVVNEAMSCGRPCLVSDHVGCGPDLVTAKETGYVFPLGDVNAIAAQMAHCASQPNHLRSMGELARTRISRCSIRAAVDGLLQALFRVGAHA